MGSASSIGSNRPRTRPTATFASRSSSAPGRNRSVSLGLPAERLDDQRAVEALVRDLADLGAQLLGAGRQRARAGAGRRRFSTTIAGKTRKPDQRRAPGR